MSSSWTRDRAFRTVADTATGDRGGDGPGRERGRGQASPVAALAALFAVCAGLSLYATVLGGSVPAVGTGGVADPTLSRVHEAATAGGVTDPGRLPDAATHGPDGRRLNVTLSVGDDRWTAGPAVPSDARDRASRLVGVRLAPGDVEPGRLSVVVWS